MRYLVLAMLTATTAAQAAGPAPASGAFYDCDVSAGQPIRCGDTYQGKAVVIVDSLVQECSIADGLLTACEGAYQGRAVVPHQGMYKECDIADGQVSRCIAWHEGKAAVWKGPGQPRLATPAKGSTKDTKATTKPKKK